MPNSGLFIEGIYNYCDRWCERCPLTLRCRLYASEQVDGGSVESHDTSNAAFWSAVQNVLAQTKELISRLAGDPRGELQMIDVSNATLPPPVNLNQHRLAAASADYAETAADWLDAHDRLLDEQHAELENLASMGVQAPALENDTLALADALDVIRWYHQQIYAKLCRALGSRLEQREPGDSSTRLADDALGSVKVALIGIDRSIAAWSELARSLPEESDMLLDLLVRLDRLRRDAEQEFPLARSFVRPGFDEQ
jgi:hypothetical protein